MVDATVRMALSVSAIIPVYNCAPHLRQCIESIIGQTEQSREIIAVDDGPADESAAILREYEEKLGGKMHAIEQENAGPAKARNRVIDIADGKHLAFLDADDFLDPGCFELAHKQAEHFYAQL